MAEVLCILLQKNDPFLPWGFQLSESWYCGRKFFEVSKVCPKSMSFQYLTPGDVIMKLQGSSPEQLRKAQIEALINQPARSLELVVKKASKKWRPSIPQGNRLIDSRSDSQLKVRPPQYRDSNLNRFGAQPISQVRDIESRSDSNLNRWGQSTSHFRDVNPRSDFAEFKMRQSSVPPSRKMESRSGTNLNRWEDTIPPVRDIESRSDTNLNRWEPLSSLQQRDLETQSDSDLQKWQNSLPQLRDIDCRFQFEQKDKGGMHIDSQSLPNYETNTINILCNKVYLPEISINFQYGPPSEQLEDESDDRESSTDCDESTVSEDLDDTTSEDSSSTPVSMSADDLTDNPDTSEDASVSDAECDPSSIVSFKAKGVLKSVTQKFDTILEDPSESPDVEDLTRETTVSDSEAKQMELPKVQYCEDETVTSPKRLSSVVSSLSYEDYALHVGVPKNKPVGRCQKPEDRSAMVGRPLSSNWETDLELPAEDEEDTQAGR